MATHYSSGQYEDAYCPRNQQSWGLAKIYKEHPSAREGYTQIIANDRGHILPSVPRSKTSPWGTYMGTWEMPLKIPPAKVNLTSRSVDAAACLTEWVNKSAALTTACNGFCPEIIGKPSNPPVRIPKESSVQHGRPTSSGLTEKMPAQETIQARVGATPKAPLSRQPGAMDIRMKDTVPDIQDSCQLEPKEPSLKSGSGVPLSRQPGCIDVRLKDTGSPKSPAPSRPLSRELTVPRRANSAGTPASGRPRSLEGRPKGDSTPELLAPSYSGSMEVTGSKAATPEAVLSSRPVTKGNPVPEFRKTPAQRDANQSARGASRLDEEPSN